MLEGLFYTLIGKWGLGVIDFATNNPGIILVASGLWLTIFYLGRYQLNTIRTKTEAWVLESAKQILMEHPNLNAAKLFDQLYPEWEQNLRGSAYFIMHRYEIWPVPATARFVKDRIDFSADWLEGYLWANGIKLPGSKAPEKDEHSPYLPKVPK